MTAKLPLDAAFVDGTIAKTARGCLGVLVVTPNYVIIAAITNVLSAMKGFVRSVRTNGSIYVTTAIDATAEDAMTMKKLILFPHAVDAMSHVAMIVVSKGIDRDNSIAQNASNQSLPH